MRLGARQCSFQQLVNLGLNSLMTVGGQQLSISTTNYGSLQVLNVPPPRSPKQQFVQGGLGFNPALWKGSYPALTRNYSLRGFDTCWLETELPADNLETCGTFRLSLCATARQCRGALRRWSCASETICRSFGLTDQV
jgi:hypothetical protein